MTNLTSKKDSYVVLVKGSDIALGPGNLRDTSVDVLDTARLVNGGSTTAAMRDLRETAASDIAAYGKNLQEVGIPAIDYAKGMMYSGEAPLAVATWSSPVSGRVTKITISDPALPLSISFLNYCRDREIRIQLGRKGPVIV